MYLVEIDEETGLIKDDAVNDGWKAIKDFKKVFDKYGLEGMTLIALSADYQSMYRYYSDEDRPHRSMDEIYDNRHKFDFHKNELLQKAYKKYKDLQFNTDLEQERINQSIKLRYLEKLNEANDQEDDNVIDQYIAKLGKHEDRIGKFNERFERDESLKEAVTKNGYKLSRIENDLITRKNSKFAEHGNNIKNPNQLGLDAN